MGSVSWLAGINLNIGDTHYAILDQGAHALAWQPPGAGGVLWCSRLACFEPGVAIRGGVPVIVPWSTPVPTAASYHLESPRAPGVLGPAGVVHCESFSVALTVGNTGDEPFTYEAALHTYCQPR